MAAQRTLRTPFRVLAVVLDPTRSFSESGVYFYMAGSVVSGGAEPDLEVCPDDTEVWRGLGISEVARRLGIAVLDERSI